MIGSVAVLLLLLCLFGLAVRYIASATLMIGVDNDLRHQLARATAPHQPPGDGGGGPGGPPPGDMGGGSGPPPFGGDDGGGGGPGGPPPFSGNGGNNSGVSFGGNDHQGFGDGSPGGHPAENADSRGAGIRQGQSQSQSRGSSRVVDADPYGPRRYNSSLQTYGPGGEGLPPIDPASLRRALAGQTVFSTITKDGQRVRVLSEPDVSGPGPGSGPEPGPSTQSPGQTQNQNHGQAGSQSLPPNRRGAAQAAYPLGGVDRALKSVDYALLMLIPVALVCAGAGGWWITGRALGRVGQITRAAAAIGARNLSERLPAAGRDEFSRLAQTFNGLLDRVDAAFQEQRRFTADASHELKTPLTVIQGTTSLALSMGEDATLDRSAIQEIDSAAASMAHLVQDLLYLARADAGLAGGEAQGSGGGGARRVELLLADPIERAVGSVAPRSRARITLRQPDEPVCVEASEAELTRLFLNLLENAARYTPEGGEITVTVTVARSEDGRMAIATVADTGIGIAPEHLPCLTDRFYRVDDSRTRAIESGEAGGSGLGLAICKSIAESHGGSLEIASEVGVGTTVTVRLPACTMEG